jgi:hypothetical protein
MTSPISMTRLEMETAWLSKVKAAERHYNAAAAQYDAVLSEERTPLAPTRGAAHAVWKAALEKSGTRREYLDVLNTFTRLVVDGEAPSQE